VNPVLPQRVVVLIDGASDAQSTEPPASSRVVPAIADRLRADGASAWVGGPKRHGTDDASTDIDPFPQEQFLLCEMSEELSVLDALDRVIDVSGRLDAIFVNAMIDNADGPILELDTHRMRAVLDRAVLGTAVVVREAARRMVGGGAICVCITAPSIVAQANRAVLESANAAVMALAKSASVELATRGICVTILCAGPRPAQQQVLFGRGLIETPGPPPQSDDLAEIASVASFLLGPESMFCTGGTFSMDGAKRE
jgi:3(or 17)beta-hydroxysteroid dehydrogenase